MEKSDYKQRNYTKIYLSSRQEFLYLHENILFRMQQSGFSENFYQISLKQAKIFITNVHWTSTLHFLAWPNQGTHTCTVVQISDHIPQERLTNNHLIYCEILNTERGINYGLSAEA